jgi:Flp pilus assembly protein CpaB
MAYSSTRTRNLAIAAALAVVAALLTAILVSRAQGGTKPAAPPATAAATAPVLVATADLPVGTTIAQAIAQKAIVETKVAPSALQPTALTSLKGLGADVVLQPVYEGQQLLAKAIGVAAAQGLPSQLSGKLRLIQVAGDANQLLQGTLQTGQTVDVVTTVGNKDTGIVLRRILVARAASATSPAVLLELTDAQAQKLFYVLKNESWTFVLRPAAHAKASTVKPTTQANLLKG